MPTNLYGPGDNYHPEHSHVAAALIRRFHEAKLASAASVAVWGTGRPRREFLAVDDLADACVFVLEELLRRPSSTSAPARTSRSPNLRASLPTWSVMAGDITFDPSRPDGTPQKLARRLAA